MIPGVFGSNAARNARHNLAPRDPAFHYGLHTRRVPCITANHNWALGNDIPRRAMTEYHVLKDLAIIFAVSLLVILVFHRIKLPALPGFIVAGVLLGPNALGLVSDVHQVESLAKVGVILLLFTIGIEFSLSRLREMGRQVIVGGGAQVGLTVALSCVLAMALHLSWRVSLLVGFLVALSSTAIVLKGLTDKGEIYAPHGRLATGVLIFQDLCVVPMMLVLPFLAGRSGGGAGALFLALGKAVLVVISVLVLARTVVPRVLAEILKTRSSWSGRSRPWEPRRPVRRSPWVRSWRDSSSRSPTTATRPWPSSCHSATSSSPCSSSRSACSCRSSSCATTRRLRWAGSWV